MLTTTLILVALVALFTMGVVQSGESLTRGIRREFATQWRHDEQLLQAELGNIFTLGLTTNEYETLFGYRDAIGTFKRKEWGNTTRSRPVRSRTFAVVQHEWENAITWLEKDRLYDQLGDLNADGREAGSKWARLDRDITLGQILENSSDPDKLPSVPNAPDGGAMYSATDGDSADRFGVSGGNIVTGQVFTTPQEIRDAYFALVTRALSWLDWQGTLFFNPGIIAQGTTLIVPLSLYQVTWEAFFQDRTSDGAVSVDNITTRIPGWKVPNVISAPELTATAMYLFFDGLDKSKRPIVSVTGKEPVGLFYGVDLNNSDRTRDQSEEGVVYNGHRTYGVSSSFTVKAVA